MNTTEKSLYQQAIEEQQNNIDAIVKPSLKVIKTEEEKIAFINIIALKLQHGSSFPSALVATLAVMLAEEQMKNEITQINGLDVISVQNIEIFVNKTFDNKRVLHVEIDGVRILRVTLDDNAGENYIVLNDKTESVIKIENK